MKVYISADMEGTSGIVHSNQTEPEHAEYPAARKLMIGEVNAAIEGAFKGGAKEVLVNDSHDGMRNLAVEDMHPDAIVLSGAPKPHSMMTAIDASFDAAFFTGYHARAGSSFANLDHTWDGPRVIQGVWLNGVEVGEVGLNAALAGHHVSVVPVAGWSEGQSRSVKAGLHALAPRSPLPAPLSAVLFLLADQPGVSPELLSTLIQRHRKTLAPIVAPRFDGQRGNPVLFDRVTFPEFDQLGGDVGARPVILTHRDEIAWVDWPTPEILEDIDVAADYNSSAQG